MVERITILEPHFHDVQFGPVSIDDATPGIDDATSSSNDDAGPVETDSESASESKSRLVTVLQGATVFVLLFGVLWILLSRLLPSDTTQDE